MLLMGNDRTVFAHESAMDVDALSDMRWQPIESMHELSDGAKLHAVWNGREVTHSYQKYGFNHRVADLNRGTGM